MSYTIDNNLLATQKTTAYEPSLLLTVSDHGRPHSKLHFSLTAQDNEPTAGCSIPGTVIIRARHNTGVGVEWQRITGPETQGEWESWTLWDAAGGYPALFVAGSYIVFVWQDLGTNAVKWKRSSDNGLTWGSEQTIWTPAYALNHLQVGATGSGDAGDTRDGAMFYAVGDVVYQRAYFSDTDSWGAEESLDLGAQVVGLGVSGGDSNFFSVLAALADYVNWSTRSIVGTAFNDGSWETPRHLYGAHGGTANAYNFAWLSLVELTSGDRWYSFSLATDKAAGALFDSTQVIGSVVGLDSISSPARLGVGTADRLTHLEWSGGVVYSASYNVVYKSSPVTTVTASTGRVIEYDLSGSERGAGLRIVLDNRDGVYDGLLTGYLGAKLVFERGAVVSGTSRRVTLPTFWIVSVDKLARGTWLAVGAVDAVAMLRRVAVDTSYRWDNLETIYLAPLVAALAGYDLEYTAARYAVPSFVLQSGRTPYDALLAIFNQYGGVTFTVGDGIWVKGLPASPSSIYDFGSGQHPVFTEDEAGRVLPASTHVLAFGDDVGGEAVDLDVQAEIGFSSTRFLTQKHISTTVDANAAASAVLAEITGAVSQADIECLPAFHLQVYDAVQFDGEVRYITGIREEYDTAESRWLQRIELGDISARRGGSAGGVSIEVGDGDAAPVRRANLVSFDSAAWTALVQIEDSPSATSMPVGQWVPSSVLAVGSAVAVLLFDESNPNDGVILGPYGAASPAFDDYYYTQTELDTSGAGGAVHWNNVTNKPQFIPAAFYLHDDVSDIAGYEQLLDSPTVSGTEAIDTVAVTSGAGEVLIDAYATPALGLTLLPGGTWTFVTWGVVDNVAGASEIVIRFYKRDAAGTETELFNTTTGEINDTTPVELETDVVHVDVTLVETDRLVVKYFAKTSSAASIDVSLYYEGATRYTHIHTPSQSGINAHTHVETDVTDLHAHANKAVLDATTASFLLTDESKLDAIEAGATADQSASEILAALLTVDGSGSLLDADKLDNKEATDFLLITGAQAGATSQAQDFGANGIKADSIADSSGAGIAVADDLDMASGADVYPGGDAAGIKQRTVDIFNTPDNHFDTSFSGFSWAAYTGFVQPGNISVAAFPSIVRFFNGASDGPIARAFAYTTFTYGSVAIINARLVCGLNCRTGVRFDDATNNNYVEYFLEYDTGLMKLRYRYAIGGSVVGPVDVWSTGYPLQFVTLQLLRTGGAFFAYYAINSPVKVLTTSIGWTATPQRIGLYHEHLSGASNAERSSLIDWINTNV